MIIFSTFFLSFLCLNIFPFTFTLTFYFLDFLLLPWSSEEFSSLFLLLFFSFSALFLLFLLILNSPLNDAIISNPLHHSLHHSLPPLPPLFSYFFLFIYPNYFPPLSLFSPSSLIFSFFFLFHISQLHSHLFLTYLPLLFPFPSTCNFIFLQIEEHTSELQSLPAIS